MEALTLIIALSTILWFVIEKFHPIWQPLTYGSYITMLVAAIGSFGITFGFGLDLIFAIGLVKGASLQGQIMTALVLMSGSSAISEIMQKIKGEDKKVPKE